MGTADGPCGCKVWSTDLLIRGLQEERGLQQHWGDGFGMGNVSRRSGPGGEATMAHAGFGQHVSEGWDALLRCILVSWSGGAGLGSQPIRWGGELPGN